MTHDIQKIACDYMKDNSTLSGGYVLVFNGVAFGWNLTIEHPESVEPGAIAYGVDNGDLYVAEGGNQYDGAVAWVAL